MLPFFEKRSRAPYSSIGRSRYCKAFFQQKSKVKIIQKKIYLTILFFKQTKYSLNLTMTNRRTPTWQKHPEPKEFCMKAGLPRPWLCYPDVDESWTLQAASWKSGRLPCSHMEHKCLHWWSQPQLFTSSLLLGVDRWPTQLYSSHFLAHKTDTPARKYSCNKSIPNKTPGCKLQHGAQTSMQSNPLAAWALNPWQFSSH